MFYWKLEARVHLVPSHVMHQSILSPLKGGWGRQERGYWCRAFESFGKNVCSNSPPWRNKYGSNVVKSLHLRWFISFKSLNATIKQARVSVRVRVLIQVSPPRGRTSRLNAPHLQMTCDRQQSHLNVFKDKQQTSSWPLFPHKPPLSPCVFNRLHVTHFGGCTLKVQQNNFKPQTNLCFANTTAFPF